jgi:hypothetical protein
VLSFLRRVFAPSRHPREADVELDPGVANSRATGGAPHQDGDSGGTTGTGESGEFVGRVAGQDEGYAGETGAEARAEAERLGETP